MPSFASLAAEVLAQAERLDQVLTQHRVAYTSFTEDTLESLPEDAQQMRWDLMDASHSLRQLARGAKLSGLDIAYSWTDQLVLRIIWRYKLASAVPVNGSATYDEVASTSGLQKSLVIRTIRSAITLNIFEEPKPGIVSHTAISKLLATDERYYNAVGLQLEDIGPASLKLIEAWEKFGHDSGEPNQSAFSLNNGGRSMFTVFAEEPDRALRFDSAMKYYAEDKGHNFFELIDAFDWSTLDSPGSRLIDLGGGYGQMCSTLAEHTQHLAFTVQDLPHAVEQGRQKLLSQFEGRISFEAHSFLEPQAPRESPVDAYLISRVLHNWSDYYSVQILRSLIPALRTGSRILIWDAVLPDDPVQTLSGRFNLQQDFIMATISNGKDRSLEEFRQVLELSDKRFKIESVTTPKNCKLTMIEVSWNV